MCSGLGKFFIPWGRRSVPWVPRGSPSLPTRERGNTSTICRFQFKVPFSSAVHPQEGGGRKRDDEGSTQRPNPECRDPSEQEKRGRKDGAPQKGGRRAPEERGGGKLAPPPRDNGGTRSRRVRFTARRYDHSDIDACPASTGCNRPFGKRRNFGTCTAHLLAQLLLYLHNQSFFPNMIRYNHLSPLLNSLDMFPHGACIIHILSFFSPNCTPIDSTSGINCTACGLKILTKLLLEVFRSLFLSLS